MAVATAATWVKRLIPETTGRPTIAATSAARRTKRSEMIATVRGLWFNQSRPGELRQGLAQRYRPIDSVAMAQKNSIVDAPVSQAQHPWNGASFLSACGGCVRRVLLGD
ncbi:hypothetical protein GCM10008174_19200 [Methylopila turkensis]|uniref:Uncharacterized protein n=1 Tax=Methylopila turkensis TaxID=1437816 RepID=A0A9W6JQZ3_9HYPH|nr:hypothetical protein GCM10008174_19200 [Methylopila turkensis]